jgi:excisionase family DNA binding protein
VPEDRKLLPVTVAAHRLGIGRTKLYELIRSGQIPTVAIGTRERQDGTIAGRRLIPVEACDAYADALQREYRINS